MTNYTSIPYSPDTIPTTGILLVNLGTPVAPTPAALRCYLGEFLADPRITELPRWLWWLILHGVILRFRPARAAKNYQTIWTEKGSPLLAISQAQVKALQEAMGKPGSESIVVALGMRYGFPSIAMGLEQLREAHAQRIVILPLYPQYASATTGSTFDAVSEVLRRWRWVPELHFISHYYDQPVYLRALVAHIQRYWAKLGSQPEKLLFSFHGIPKRMSVAGDPYFYHCQATARLVAEQLGLKEEHWQTVFQSRFGREEWLTPYTEQILLELGKAGMKRVDVVCPGFAADCLETLEEIDRENRDLFLRAGGQEFHYIPALNESVEHIEVLLELVKQYQ